MSNDRAMDGQRPSHPQQGPNMSIRLPRLHMLDEDAALSPLGAHLNNGRGRSTSISSLHRDASHGGMAGFGPRSPASETHAAAGDGSRSSMSSPSLSSRTRVVPQHAGFPVLPEPSRRSTMLEGSLPPLTALQTDSPRTSPPRQDPSYFVSGGAPRLGINTASVQGAIPRSAKASSMVSPSTTYPPAYPSHMSARGALPGPGMAIVTGPGDASGGSEVMSQATRKAAKAHVSSACLNCKRAHLACDSERPCRRCAKLGKTATCVDVQHKKRGRPRLKDRETPASSPTEMTGLGLPARWSPRQDSYFTQAVNVPVPPAWGGPSGTRARSFSAASAQMSALSSPEHPMSAPAVGPRRSLVATLLCGTDFVAAHVSQESQALFGLLPSQIYRRSTWDLIHPEDCARFEHAWARLLQPVGLQPSPFPAAGTEIMRTSTCNLLLPARGTIFIEEVVQLRLAGGVWAPCSIRIHLGGAFGLDLYRPETKDRAFVVCSVCPVERGSPATHPDLAQLRAAEFPPRGWSNATFRTPVDSLPPSPLPSLSFAEQRQYSQQPWSPQDGASVDSDRSRSPTEAGVGPMGRKRSAAELDELSPIDTARQIPRLSALSISPSRQAAFPHAPSSDVAQESLPRLPSEPVHDFKREPHLTPSPPHRRYEPDGPRNRSFSAAQPPLPRHPFSFHPAEPDVHLARPHWPTPAFSNARMNAARLSSMEAKPSPAVKRELLSHRPPSSSGTAGESVGPIAC